MSVLSTNLKADNAVAYLTKPLYLGVHYGGGYHVEDLSSESVEKYGQVGFLHNVQEP